MKKISLIVICALTALFFASCQTGKREDKNGDTPTSVVDKMYQAIKANDFESAASYNKIPDTIKMKLKEETNVYQEFQNNPKIKDKKDVKVIITGDEWRTFLINKMQNQSKDYSLDSWEIVSEEISKTDPNSAKVKTTIHITNKGVASEADCSFPLKRENDEWKIIG
ncbi:MAG: hypothetical protein II887_01485 [Bacteroidales bacterium]|nr:hypothetical protein [Bacteroidales bacterium]